MNSLSSANLNQAETPTDRSLNTINPVSSDHYVEWCPPTHPPASKLIQHRLLDVPDELDRSWYAHFYYMRKMISEKDEATAVQELKQKCVELHTEMNIALFYGILTDARSAQIYYRYLTQISQDSFQTCIAYMQRLIMEKYPKILDPCRTQLLWIAREFISRKIAEVDNVIICLLRQVIGGDVSSKNIWLANTLLDILEQYRPWLFSRSNLIPYVFHAFARFAIDHNRTQHLPLREKEANLCVSLWKEKREDVSQLGRELVRILHETKDIPGLTTIWKELRSTPEPENVEAMKEGPYTISKLMSIRTPRAYLQARLTKDMEDQLRFLMTHVKLGLQKRYQLWFANRYLSHSDSESLLPDLVRYICSVYHPSNSVLQSKIMPRWAVIGWLLKCCKRPENDPKIKLALFIDYLYFDKTDNIMNIEPALLLMVQSLKNYPDITLSLLQYLFFAMEGFAASPFNCKMMRDGVSFAFTCLRNHNIINNISVLINCSSLKKMPTLIDKMKQLLPEHFDSSKDELNLNQEEKKALKEIEQKNTMEIETRKEVKEKQLKISSQSNNQDMKSGQDNDDEKDNCKELKEDEEKINVSETKFSKATGWLQYTKDLTGSTALKEIQKQQDTAWIPSMKQEENSNDYFDKTISKNESEEEEKKNDFVNDEQAMKNVNEIEEEEEINNYENEQDEMNKIKNEQEEINNNENNNTSSIMVGNLKVFEKEIKNFELYSSQSIHDSIYYLKEILNLSLKFIVNNENLGIELGYYLYDHMEKEFLVYIPEKTTEATNRISFLFQWIINSPLENQKILQTLLFGLWKKNICIRYYLLVVSIYKYQICFDGKHVHKHIFNPYFNLLEQCKEDQTQGLLNDLENSRQIDTARHLHQAFFPSSSSSNSNTLNMAIGIACMEVIPFLCQQYFDLIVGNSRMIQFLVQEITPSQLHELSCHLLLNDFSLFGSRGINIILSSFEWSSFEQFCLWELLSSELNTHKIKFLNEKNNFYPSIRKIFACIDPSKHSEAMSGLLKLLKHHVPDVSLFHVFFQLSFKEYDIFLITLLSSWCHEHFELCCSHLLQILSQEMKSNHEEILKLLDEIIQSRYQKNRKEQPEVMILFQNEQIREKLMKLVENQTQTFPYLTTTLRDWNTRRDERPIKKVRRLYSQ